MLPYNSLRKRPLNEICFCSRMYECERVCVCVCVCVCESAELCMVQGIECVFLQWPVCVLVISERYSVKRYQPYWISVQIYLYLISFR